MAFVCVGHPVLIIVMETHLNYLKQTWLSKDWRTVQDPSHLLGSLMLGNVFVMPKDVDCDDECTFLLAELFKGFVLTNDLAGSDK